MRFTKTELLVFNQITNNNKNRFSSIYKSLKKNKTYISEILTKLRNKKLIIKEKNRFSISSYSFSIKLKLLLEKYPNLINILKNKGLNLLLLFFEKQSVKQVCNKTNLKQSSIYNYIKKTKKFSILKKVNNKYILNTKQWQDLKDFIKDYSRHNKYFDKRIPKGSKIYFKNKKEIIFSFNKKIGSAVLTSFSVFENYNLLIYTNTNYYYLPKKKLNKKDILLHTLKIVDFTKSFSQRLYLALFYYKYKTYFKNINHSILNKLNKIYKGEKIQGFPSLEEIKEKAKIYNINM